MIKPVLMIHGVKPEYFDHPLDQFILTFDDGLIDHWKYFSQIQSVPTKKKFFITCDWIGKPDFLTVEQIKSMGQANDTEIGGHGFSHRPLDDMDMTEMRTYITREIEMMCDWFQTNLGFSPGSLAYPFNDSGFGMYTQIAKDFGIRDFFGGERIDIEWLADRGWTRGRF